jgi:hypothetical protein
MVFMKTTGELSDVAKEILDKIVSSKATRDGRGVSVIDGFPSNNEGIACVFSLRGGTTVGYKRPEFNAALSELLRKGFLMELDVQGSSTRYKLIEE